mmetsp:Transcript_32710/g.52180  ORF Transcript_32710/g.52180 Transcript_32710/m.52180 type:complete len:118 (+) Transcript_32710:37-390(+)
MKAGITAGALLVGLVSASSSNGVGVPYNGAEKLAVRFEEGFVVTLPKVFGSNNYTQTCSHLDSPVEITPKLLHKYSGVNSYLLGNRTSLGHLTNHRILLFPNQYSSLTCYKMMHLFE